MTGQENGLQKLTAISMSLGDQQDLLCHLVVLKTILKLSKKFLKYFRQNQFTNCTLLMFESKDIAKKVNRLSE